MPQVAITIDVDAAAGRADTSPVDRRGKSAVSIDIESISGSQSTRGKDQMSNGFVMGDLMAVIGAESAASQRIITSTLQQSLARLDAGAQKSLFEVDANETGMTNANYPRAIGGSKAAGE